jgi:ACT domain-containing protein
MAPGKNIVTVVHEIDSSLIDKYVQTEMEKETFLAIVFDRGNYTVRIATSEEQPGNITTEIYNIGVYRQFDLNDPLTINRARIDSQNTIKNICEWYIAEIANLDNSRNSRY